MFVPEILRMKFLGRGARLVPAFGSVSSWSEEFAEDKSLGEREDVVVKAGICGRGVVS